MSSGSVSGITFGGLASNIDTNGIIDKLIQIQKIPLTALTQRQTDLQSKQSVYAAFGQRLSAIGTAASALDTAAAFNPIAASSSDNSVATITGSTNATAGSYALSITQLAQAEKIASAAQQDTTSALNLTGSFVVNGATVNVVATDSLTSIAQRINGLNVGVTASLVDGGAGSAFLTLGSNSTGVVNKSQLADSSGTVLGSLGLLKGAATTREPITNGATSFAFRNKTDSIGTLLGNTGLAASTIQINGTNVTINASDTLQNIADNINAAGAGVTASVRAVTSGSTTSYKLDITGAAGTPTFTDSNNMLQSLGVLQQGYGTELVQGQDAKFSLDSLQLTSATNTVTTAIPGATLTLLKGTNASPGTSILSMVQDTTAIKSKINDFVTAYNNTVDYVASQSTLDTTTFNTGPLFGDPVASQAMTSLSSQLFNNIPGVTGQFSNLTGAGFTLDKSGHLVVDDTILSNALSTNPQGVAGLFQTTGTGSNPNITYVSDSTKTKASGATGYEVDISQLAAQSSYTGETAQTVASTVNEHITFSGKLFNATPYTLIVTAGANASGMVAAINNDSTLKNLVVASLDGSGKLNIQSKRYGSTTNFTVTSDLAAGNDNSGIGNANAGAYVTGMDVAGTINGEAATGAGQFLTGNAGNATTDGLQIQYNGTTIGVAGTIKFAKGIAPQANDLLNSFTDPVAGLITSTNNSLQKLIDGLGVDMTNLANEISQNQLDLQQKFANMETAINQLQMQGQSLAASTGSTVTNTPAKATIPTG